MKSFVILIAFALVSNLAFAQKKQKIEVPPEVKKAFATRFPDAKVEEWQKEGDCFEAEFELNDIEHSVLIDAKGDILEVEEEIKVKQLPSAISAYVAKNYPKQKIKEAAKITNAAGVVSYEAEIKSKDLLFDATGNFLKEDKL
jgi:hypothetical protein